MLVNNTNALGAVTATVVVTNGGTLDWAALLRAGHMPIFGDQAALHLRLGVNGNGCIINSSANHGPEVRFRNVTLAGDAAIGGNAGRWDFGRPPRLGSFKHGRHPYNLYKVGTNYVAFLGVTIDTNLANIDIQGGELGLPTSHDRAWAIRPAT